MVADGEVAASVTFGEGRRPEAATHVRVEGFAGPLALLLSLIEARQLDVLTVRLGDMAEAYLEALAVLPGDRIGHVSSFVAIASQLILIKSRALLPRHEDPAAAPSEDDEAPDPEAELRARLLLYRAHRDAGRRLVEAPAALRGGLFRREPTAARAAAVAGAASPDPRPLEPVLLVTALDGLIRIAPLPEPPPETVPRTVTLTERARIIRAALRDAPVVVLQELLGGVRDRVVLAVTFLAMLELMKRREIVVEQDEPWGPIMARRATLEEGGLEAADEPLDESLESFR